MSKPIAALLLVGCMLCANSASLAQQSKLEIFRDWRFTCDNEGECRVVQVLTNNQNRPVFTTEIVRVDDQLIATLTLPLGVYIPPGLSLKVGESEPVDVPLTVCLPSGCKSTFALEGDLLTKMRNGINLQVRFFEAAEVPGEITIPAAGFRDAQNALDSQ